MSSTSQFYELINLQRLSNKNNIQSAHIYLILAYKYAGNIVNIIIDHFMHCVVFSVSIAKQIELSKSVFKWNQKINLCLIRGATVIMKIKICKRYMKARNIMMETEKRENEGDLNLAEEIINEWKNALTFHSKMKKHLIKLDMNCSQKQTKK